MEQELEPIQLEELGLCVDSHGSAIGMPQLCGEWIPNQIFWLVIALIVMYYVLSRIAIPRIAAVLAERQGTITNDIAAAEELKAKAADAEKAYDKALADARAEANRIADETRARIQADLDAEMAKADERIAAKTISHEDLSDALQASPHGDKPADVSVLIDAAKTDRPPRSARATVAELCTRQSGMDWTALIADRLGAWAGDYFDRGQALWAAPRGKSAWAAWRAFATHDLTPEFMGLRGFAAFVADASDDPFEAMARASARLGLSEASLDLYFHQLLLSLGGWSQYARYTLWRAELAGGTDSTITDLLAIRLLWEEAL